MKPRFSAIPLPWVMGIVFSGISVHSFLYNQASFPVPDAPGAASAPRVVQGPVPARPGNHAETVGTDSAPSDWHHHGTPERQDRPQVIEAPVEAPSETVSASLLTDMSAAEPDAMAQAVLPRAGGMAHDTEQVSEEKDPGSVDPAASVVSSRPAVRPARAEAASAGTRETGLAARIPPASPPVSIRPMARPDPRAVAAAQDVPAPQTDQTDLAAAAVSRALGLLPQPEPMVSPLRETRPHVRAREPNRERIGRILGVFETNVRRWVLIENRSGRITIIEPGDRIGSGVVSSISDGTLMIRDGETVREYRTGDSL